MSDSPRVQLNPCIEVFASVAAIALVRAEVAGRLPLRFTRSGPQLWEAFRNQLGLTDLLDLVVRDAAEAMPQAFALHRLWPEASGDELRDLSPDQIGKWVDRGKGLAEQSTDDYLRAQAQALDVGPPPAESLKRLPVPEAHHHVLELPGSGGWLAYHLASRPHTAVYYWENFTIACGTWQEQLLAGLIAFELGAPSRQELPIVRDPTLARVLNGDVAFDWIVGLREENERRADALRSFLKPEGRVVLL